MKRNSKGFTLIELLGAIVILGILIGVSVPIIVSLLDTSRNKMYINDAKKLVTQAEYKLKSNSSDIEKPDEGDCILVSMVYLDSSDFDNPPNEGKYEKESSYVVIKNNNGKLEYSVTIVEKVKKGGYKGVELVRDSVLFSNDALSHVVSFKETEVINVETDVNKGYINEKLGNDYISGDNSIAAIYNYPDLDDSSSNNDIVGTPKITTASLISTSSRGYNSLDATLQLKVEDKDTPRSNLTIYISGTSYDNALNSTPLSYGENDTFSYNINFGGEPYNKSYDGSSVKLYIVVKDPEGNSTKKTMTYKIHKNEIPEISSDSKITKRNGDISNMTVGLVKLIVSDDIDNNNTLSVCLKESATNENFTTCDNYQPYTNYFNLENSMNYTFTSCDGGSCSRDGSKHYLTIFVKDTLGGISKKKLSYTFSTNTAPVINSLTVESKKESFTTTSSKTIVVNVSAEDDIDNNDKLSVLINDTHHEATYNYSSQPIYFDIQNDYDGSTLNLKIKVIDSEGLYSEETRQYTLYNNVAPTINLFTVTSNGAACNNHALCPPENGGKLNTLISLDAEDDIDYNDLSVCISLTDNSNSCTYIPYSNFNNGSYSYTIPGDYDGSTKTIYAFVKDTLGKVTKKTYDYKVYKNQAPHISLALFNSKENSNPSTGNLNASFIIDAYDDFDDASSLKLQVVEDGVVKINNANLTDYLDRENDYTVSGSYDGSIKNIEVKVIDTDGSVKTENIQYSVYENQSPEVELFNVYSKEIPCNNSVYCPLESNGNYNAFYKLKLSDDLDSNNDLQVCLSETDSCSNYLPYTDYLNAEGNPKEFSYTFSVNDSTKPYDGTEKHLNLFAKDSNGSITKNVFTYELYKNQGPIILSNPEFITKASNENYNIPLATFTIEAEDDFDDTFQIKYCHKKNGAEEYCTSYEQYNKSKVLDNSFFQVRRPSGDNYKVYAKLKDSYGTVTTTDEIEYKLYTDISPKIQVNKDAEGGLINPIINGRTIFKDGSGNVLEEPTGQYDTYTRLKIAFSVDDPYDKYSVCISENGTTCTDYKGSFEGNDCIHSNGEMCDLKTYTAYYDKLNGYNDGDHITLYLWAKDPFGNINKELIYDNDYHVCEGYDEEDANYEYVFDDTGDPISMNRCQGMCYYSDQSGTPNNILLKYNARVIYHDKISMTNLCNSGNPVEYEVYLGCSFKDCFYKNNSYVRNAIGIKLIMDEVPWSTNINGTSYLCTGHYNLYESSYNEGDSDITLTKSNNIICKEAYDAGVYNYDSSSANPYVYIED